MNNRKQILVKFAFIVISVEWLGEMPWCNGDVAMTGLQVGSRLF